MSTGKKRNTGHSVFQRLLSHARTHGEDFNLLLLRYGIERFLYRLSISAHADRFILKGASLFLVWKGQNFRVTKDADLLAFGPAHAENLTGVFKELCQAASEDVDGIEFLPDTVRAVPIREEQEYGSVRVTLMSLLHQARIPLQFDIGFGDAVTPAPEKIEFPTILDAPAPRLLAYPRDTMIAEKLEAMVVLGMANSRMKDFYDLYVLAREFAFNGATLAGAIRATFRQRKTQIPPEPPLALTEQFAQDDTKPIQWKAFIRKSALEQDVPGFPDVLAHLREFLLPPLKAASGQALFPKEWNAGGPWVSAKPETGDI